MPIDLTLGTANLGLAYGTTIQRDLPTEAHAEAILRHARRCGFKAIDTARAYGLSEARIGRHVATGEGFDRDEIGTKLAAFPELVPESPLELGRQLAEESLALSRKALKTRRLGRVLLHRASHFNDASGANWQLLSEERAAGGISEIGVSVQTLEEARNALRRSDVDVIQLPCNILDRRFDNAEFAAFIAARSHPIKIDVRSVFLQGTLTSGDLSAFPRLSVPYDANALMNWLQITANEFAGGSLDELCLRYVASLGWVSSIVIGADTLQQLDRITEIAAMTSLPQHTIDAIRSTCPGVPEELLNPAQWLHHER